MRKEYVFSRKLGVTVVMRVSQHGDGLYLYIPRDITDVYGIIAGDKLEVQLQKLFKPETEIKEGET